MSETRLYWRRSRSRTVFGVVTRWRIDYRAALLGAAVLLTLAALLLIVFLPEEDSTSGRVSDVQLDFFDGETVRLSEFSDQPVVLNFWASWCPACVSEMPAFGEVDRRLDGQVEFIGVNTQEVDQEAALELAETTNVDYRLARDPNGAIFNEFGGISMPTTVFIAADGSVAKVHSGVIPTEEELVDVIEEELLGRES
jgi:thiol-disulfide isomerase/thioredoxin